MLLDTWTLLKVAESEDLELFCYVEVSLPGKIGVLNLNGPSGMHVSYIWDSSLAKRPREVSFACSLGIPAIPVGSESATNFQAL